MSQVGVLLALCVEAENAAYRAARPGQPPAGSHRPVTREARPEGHGLEQSFSNHALDHISASPGNLGPCQTCRFGGAYQRH